MLTISASHMSECQISTFCLSATAVYKACVGTCWSAWLGVSSHLRTIVLRNFVCFAFSSSVVHVFDLRINISVCWGQSTRVNTGLPELSPTRVGATCNLDFSRSYSKSLRCRHDCIPRQSRQITEIVRFLPIAVPTTSLSTLLERSEQCVEFR